MKKFTITTLVTAFAAVAAMAAQFDYYIKIPPIEGEALRGARSADAGMMFQVDLDLERFLAAFGNEGASSVRERSSGLATGKRQHSPMRFVKLYDKASPMLARACANGKHIPKATLICRKAGSDGTMQPYLTIELENVLVSGYWSTSGDADDRPTEEVAFNYSKISWNYAKAEDAAKAGRPVRGGWDLATNKGGR